MGDLAGTVVSVGEGCPRLKVGDAVWTVTKGAYAEYAIGVCPIVGLAPTNLDLATAGTLPEVSMTSAEALEQCGAPWDPIKKKKVVITSGSGGTGFVGVQLARAWGAETIITAATGSDNIEL